MIPEPELDIKVIRLEGEEGVRNDLLTQNNSEMQKFK